MSSLKILIKKQNIINIIKGILLLREIYQTINQTNEENYYFDELKNKEDSLKENISSNEIKLIISFISDKFKEITFDNKDKSYKNKILVFFNSLNNNKEAFYFFKEKKIENISNLKEFLLDSDEKELSLYDIDEFFKVIRFLNNDINQIKSSFELIQTFISGILNKNKFENYLNIVNKYTAIKNLFDKFLKGEGGVFTKVRDIISSSTFTLDLNHEINIYQISGKYVKENILKLEKVYVDLNSDELDDLYQRIFISIHRAGNEIFVKQFIHYYKEIKSLNYIINKLYLTYGYPKKILITFNISKMNMVCIYDSKEYNPKELVMHFKNIKKECKKIFNKSIANSDEIRLFYGRQLYLINDCIIQKNYNKIKDLISCYTNGIIDKFIDYNYIDETLNNDIYENMINNIIKYIKQQLLYNNKNIEDIYLKNEILYSENYKNEKNIAINENNLYKGFYFLSSSMEEDFEIVNFYNNATGNNPINTNILYCNNDTSIEEINIFIIRAIYCKVNALFTIAIPEYINNTKKGYIIKYIKKKSKKESEMMRSCLVILFNLKDAEFHQSILKIKNIKAINYKDFPYNNNNIKENEINIKIISSNICGLGKSSYINKDKTNKILYLPIGGEMSKNDLVERLKDIFSDNVNFDLNKYILHINLTQTNDIELVKDFLFKLLILKKCELNENIIFIKPNISIYIELENTFCTYLNTYKILTLFIEKTITIKNIELTNEVKMISTMLTLFENNEILNRNIDIEKDIKNIKNKSNEIILKYLEIKYPNYYQINTFIKVLSCEFQKFNQCLGFSPSILKENAPSMGMRIEEALELRKLIIGSLIKITKYFTIGPYEKLIKIQDNTKQFLSSENDNIMKTLKIDINSITYDDIKPSLVVFNNDGNSVTILTTCSENEQEFKNLEKLYNSQNMIIKTEIR